ncbi:MAG: M48 family metalloprotease [Patescibacteria group bacterium]
MNITEQKSKNIQKTWLLMASFFVFVIAVGWAFSYIFADQSILYFAVGFSVLMNVLSYWFSDKIVLKMAGAKQISRADNRILFDTVERLVHRTGLPMPKLYLISDQSPNAFATGRNAQHSAVAVTSGLLNILDERELEGVISHELSHILNKDILLATVAVVLAGFISLISDFFLRATFFRSLGGRDNDNQAGGLLAAAGIALAVLAPLVAMLIRLAISRKREFLADASGAALTHNPSGLASALEKISQNSAPLKRASYATAHLYISSPFRGKKSSNWFAKLFMTHPPVEDRVRILRGARG